MMFETALTIVAKTFNPTQATARFARRTFRKDRTSDWVETTWITRLLRKMDSVARRSWTVAQDQRLIITPMGFSIVVVTSVRFTANETLSIFHMNIQREILKRENISSLRCRSAFDLDFFARTARWKNKGALSEAYLLLYMALSANFN